jgi:hypothetical protein
VFSKISLCLLAVFNCFSKATWELQTAVWKGFGTSVEHYRKNGLGNCLKSLKHFTSRKIKVVNKEVNWLKSKQMFYISTCSKKRPRLCFINKNFLIRSHETVPFLKPVFTYRPELCNRNLQVLKISF